MRWRWWARVVFPEEVGPERARMRGGDGAGEGEGEERGCCGGRAEDDIEWLCGMRKRAVVKGLEGGGRSIY